jgi:hypothetical protein
MRYFLKKYNDQSGTIIVNKKEPNSLIGKSGDSVIEETRR